MRRAIALAENDLDEAEHMTGGGWVFFDRGLIDALVARRHLTGEAIPRAAASRFHRQVFLAPPWPEIYVNDQERRHGIEAGIAEYKRLLEAYRTLGFEVFVLPKTAVAARADFVLNTLAVSAGD